MWRKSVTFFLISLILLIAAAFIVPSFIDWSHYRKSVALSLSDAMRAQVSIHGTIGFKMLPRPELDVTDVDIVAADWQMHMDHLALATRLAPLLHGEIEITRANLNAPQITYRMTDQPAASGRPAKSPNLPIGILAEAGGGMAEAISLKEINLTQGALRVIVPDRQVPIIFSQLHGRLRAAALHGPYDFTGGFIYDGNPFAATLQIGVATGAGSFPIALHIENAAHTTKLNLHGALQGVTGQQATTGKRIVGDITASLHALVLAGPLQLTARGLTMDRLNIQTPGGTIGNASAHWIFAESDDVAVETNFTDLDAAGATNIAAATGDYLPGGIASHLAQLAPWTRVAFGFGNGRLLHMEMASPLLQAKYAQDQWQASGADLGNVLARLAAPPVKPGLHKPFAVKAQSMAHGFTVQTFIYGTTLFTGTLRDTDGGWRANIKGNQFDLSGVSALAQAVPMLPPGQYDLRLSQLKGLAIGDAAAQLSLITSDASHASLHMQTGPQLITATYNGNGWTGQSSCGKGVWQNAPWPHLCLAASFTAGDRDINFSNLDLSGTGLKMTAENGHYNLAQQIFTADFETAGGNLQASLNGKEHSGNLAGTALQLSSLLPQVFPGAAARGTVNGMLDFSVGPKGELNGAGNLQASNLQFSRFNIEAGQQAALNNKDIVPAASQPGTITKAACNLRLEDKKLHCLDLNLETHALHASGNGIIDWGDHSWDFYLHTNSQPALDAWYRGPWAQSRLLLEHASK